MQPKYKLRDHSAKNNTEEDSQTYDRLKNYYNTENTSQQEVFVAGTVSVNNDTEILTGVQAHICVGQEKHDGSTIVFGILTSEKGTKAGIPGASTTRKLSDNQPISGKPQGQYLGPVIPPQIVAPGDFKIDEPATEYVNQPDIKEQMIKSAQEALAYVEPIKYKPTGITMDDLNAIRDIKPIIDKKNKFRK
jgi:hypothetical protein